MLSPVFTRFRFVPVYLEYRWYYILAHPRISEPGLGAISDISCTGLVTNRE